MSDFILAGATGLVGQEILSRLDNEQPTANVWCVGRRAPAPLRQNVQFVEHNFVSKINWPKKMPKNASAICTLGTTIKQAGSQAAFRQVDFDFVLNFALESLKAGARSLHVVTAHGASSRSRIFYNQVKGEIEEKLQSLGLPELHIYRPSLLIGERNEKRIGEDFAAAATKLLSPLFKLPGLKAIEPTPVTRLAAFILGTAAKPVLGNHIHTNAEILS